VFGIFFFFVIGVVEFGQAFRRYLVFTDALHEAAREALVVPGGTCSTDARSFLFNALARYESAVARPYTEMISPAAIVCRIIDILEAPSPTPTPDWLTWDPWSDPCFMNPWDPACIPPPDYFNYDNPDRLCAITAGGQIPCFVCGMIMSQPPVLNFSRTITLPYRKGHSCGPVPVDPPRP